jgi:hypothetical protein
MITLVTTSVFLVLNYGMFKRISLVNKCVNHYKYSTLIICTEIWLYNVGFERISVQEKCYSSSPVHTFCQAIEVSSRLCDISRLVIISGCSLFLLLMLEFLMFGICNN